MHDDTHSKFTPATSRNCFPSHEASLHVLRAFSTILTLGRTIPFHADWHSPRLPPNNPPLHGGGVGERERVGTAHPPSDAQFFTVLDVVWNFKGGCHSPDRAFRAGHFAVGAQMRGLSSHRAAC